MVFGLVKQLIKPGIPTKPDGSLFSADEVVDPNLSMQENVEALQKHGLQGDAVDYMAKEMPSDQGVTWAADSAEQVKDGFAPADLQAIDAAKAYAANPSPEAAAAAQQAAAASGHQSPGSWAAQSAAYAGTPEISMPTIPELAASETATATASATTIPSNVPAANELSAQATSGAVKQAAAMTRAPLPVEPTADLPETLLAVDELPTEDTLPTEPPLLTMKELKAVNQSLDPFIERGLAIAEGQSPIAKVGPIAMPTT